MAGWLSIFRGSKTADSTDSSASSGGRPAQKDLETTKTYQLRVEGPEGYKFKFDANGLIKIGVDEETGTVKLGKIQDTIEGRTPQTLTFKCTFLAGWIKHDSDHGRVKLRVGLIVDGELVSEKETIGGSLSLLGGGRGEAPSLL